MRLVLDTNVVASGLLWNGAPTIAADLSDDQVLACALTANADLIVSGDKQLHSLGGKYNGIRIVRPAEAVSIVEAG
ncbi:MAG: hypothetical protein WCV99_15455 [Sterolibacterium sp.]|jgi:predicted nucleic acid-binding protein